MDYLTIFGDIHGNLPALEAVLADMESRGLENRYCLGDLVGYGTFPNEVTERVRDARIPTIMGNYDLGVGHDSDDCGCAYKTEIEEARGKRSIAWTNAHTTAENKAYLRDPRACYVVLRIEDQRVDAQFIRVEYDVEAAASAIEASEMPHEFAQMLRNGVG